VGKRERIMQVIEVLDEHYETQEVPFGKSYKWCAESAVVVCECGKRATLKMADLCASVPACECGAHSAAGSQEELQSRQPEVRGQTLEDYERTHHPWLHDTQAQSEQHARDEAAYSKDSPWRYNDVLDGQIMDEE
jgi:hypothetical protein